MRYLILLCLALSGCAEVKNEPPPPKPLGVAVLPCPAMGNVGQWAIEDPREADVIQRMLESGDLNQFANEMEAINPAFGEPARRYAIECFKAT